MTSPFDKGGSIWGAKPPKKCERTIKQTPESVCHHKCICADCGVELDPIKLKEMTK